MGAGLLSHLLAQRRLRANRTPEQEARIKEQNHQSYLRKKERNVQKKENQDGVQQKILNVQDVHQKIDVDGQECLH